MFKKALCTALIALICVTSNAAEKTATPAPTASKKSSTPLRQLFEDLDYPELQVVPRASQRLRLEADNEARNWWYAHWPIQISGLSTLALGFISSSQERSRLSSSQRGDARVSRTAAQLIGASWIIGTTLIGFSKPYKRGLKRLRSSKAKKNKRGELLRERLAEESLETTSRLMKRLQTASIITNLSAAAYVGAFVDEEGAVFAAISGLLAFLPLWFEDPYIYNYKKHIDYKRNIYAPLSSLGLTPIQTATRPQYVPSLNLSWVF